MKYHASISILKKIIFYLYFYEHLKYPHNNLHINIYKYMHTYISINIPVYNYYIFIKVNLSSQWPVSSLNFYNIQEYPGHR